MLQCTRVRLRANLTVYNKKDSHLPIFIFSFLVTAILQLRPIQIQIDQYKKKLRVFAKQT
jgi:hypothetical protein